MSTEVKQQVPILKQLILPVFIFSKAVFKRKVFWRYRKKKQEHSITQKYFVENTPPFSYRMAIYP